MTVFIIGNSHILILSLFTGKKREFHSDTICKSGTQPSVGTEDMSQRGQSRFPKAAARERPQPPVMVSGAGTQRCAGAVPLEQWVQGRGVRQGPGSGSEPCVTRPQAAGETVRSVSDCGPGSRVTLCKQPRRSRCRNPNVGTQISTLTL